MADTRIMQTYLPMGLSSASDIKNGVIGEIIAVCGKEVPDCFLPCDGAIAYPMTDYPELVEFFRSSFGDPRRFSVAGDSATTFRTPNLVDRFLKGTTTNGVGNFENAGLPNIKGYWSGARMHWGLGASGAMYITGSTDRADNHKNDYSTVTFNASLGEVHVVNGADVYRNDVYGKSDTVTPANMSVSFCIRYKQALSVIVDKLTTIDAYDGVSILPTTYRNTPIAENMTIKLSDDWLSYDIIEVQYKVLYDDVFTYSSLWIEDIKTDRTGVGLTIRENGDTLALLNASTIRIQNADGSYSMDSIRFTNIHGLGIVLDNIIGYSSRNNIANRHFAGEIRMYAGTSIPDGWLLCDGSEYDGSDEKYKELYEVLRTSDEETDDKHFSVPNLTSMYVEGASSFDEVGTYKAQGVPNIWGQWGGNRMNWGMYGEGAFTASGSTDRADYHKNDSSTINFLASRGDQSTRDKVYGKYELGVQLNTMQVFYLISLH